jgi:hypothetical protein
MYRDDYAEVICKLPAGANGKPYSARSFGKINGEWKNWGEDRFASVEAAFADFDKVKEKRYALFLKDKKEIIGKNAAVERREIKKFVKDFPEVVDLSSPEAACVACARAMARKDVKTLLGDLIVYFEPEQIEKMERDFQSKPAEEVAEICQTYNDAEILEVQAYREDFAEVILKIKIGKYFFTQNEGPYIRMPFGKFDGKWKGLHLPQEHAESVEAAREQFARSKDDLWKKYLELKKEARKAGTPSPDTLILMGLVENYFAKNAKEITARKTIEWGEVRKNADGSRSIRYKYEAKYVDKDAATANQIFTFDQDNVLLGVKDVEEFPQKTEKKAEDKNANNKSQEIDKRWSWLMGKSGASERNEIPLKHAEAALEIAEAELKISLDANRKVPETVPLLHIQKLELKYQLSVSQAAYYKAVWAGDEKQAKKFALDNVNDNIQYLKNAIELEKLSSKRDPSGESPSEAIEKLQTQLEKAIEDGKRANAIQYPPINAPTNYKIDSPHSPKPNFINREAST